MKQTNETPKNQGATTDQQKKANNVQHGKNEGTDQNSRSAPVAQGHSGKSGGDSSNGQKDKQGNKK